MLQDHDVPHRTQSSSSHVTEPPTCRLTRSGPLMSQEEDATTVGVFFVPSHGLHIVSACLSSGCIDPSYHGEEFKQRRSVSAAGSAVTTGDGSSRRAHMCASLMLTKGPQLSVQSSVVSPAAAPRQYPAARIHPASCSQAPETRAPPQRAAFYWCIDWEFII